MKRIDTATAAADLFGAGKNGFRDGDPLAGVLATKLNADFWNNIQETLANPIEAAGLALDGADFTQLTQAITLLGGDLGHSFVSAGGYTKLRGGLIVQWGQVTSGVGGAIAITWPIAFPTSYLTDVWFTGGTANMACGGAVATATNRTANVYNSAGSGVSGLLTSFIVLGH